jgi:hypothetical protein
MKDRLLLEGEDAPFSAFISSLMEFYIYIITTYYN